MLLHIHEGAFCTSLACLSLARMSQFSQGLTSSPNEMAAPDRQDGENRVRTCGTQRSSTAHDVGSGVCTASPSSLKLEGDLTATWAKWYE